MDYAIKFMEETYIKRQEYQIYCVVGEDCFLESKSKTLGGKPSAIQLAQGVRIKKAGGHFIIARSLQDVKDYVEREGLIGL